MVLDGLLGLYGLKYDSATACGLLLYLCSYKLDGSATVDILASIFWVFTPSVEVKHFWVDLDGKHVFVPTPSVGVVHIWMVCT